MRIRRRPDRWAIPNHGYACNPVCGYLFELRHGSWYVNTEPLDLGMGATGYAQHRWKKVGTGTWADVEDWYGDCSAFLVRNYAGRSGKNDRVLRPAAATFLATLQGR